MSLNTSLSTAMQSLVAADGALQITNNNIANANTPGYSRQIAVLQTVAPTDGGVSSAGAGVVLAGFQSVRSELLQIQIQQQTQAQGKATAQSNTMQQIQPIFTTSTQDIGTQMSALFGSLSQLSTDPASSSLREGVLVSGQNLANAFHVASNSLQTQQIGLNKQVTQDVSQINGLAQQIAALNPQLATLKQSGEDGGAVQDQQDELVRQLSQLTDLSTTQSESGITLTTGGGTVLVAGAQSFALQTSTGSDGMARVLDQNGTDMTASLQSGDLGGTVQTRVQTIPGLLSKLDTLAQQIAVAFNQVQAQGFNQSGGVGGNFFSVPTATAGSAGAIKVALTDPAGIAGSSDGAAGSNGNLVNFAAVQATPLASGATPTGTYAALVYEVGSLTANASADSSGASTSLLQLNNQRNAISAVSIDEESANLIRYQQAYEAAARVISTISNLFNVTMSMGTNAAS